MAFARAALTVTHAELPTGETLDTFAPRERVQLTEERVAATGEDCSAAILTFSAAVY